MIYAFAKLQLPPKCSSKPPHAASVAVFRRRTANLHPKGCSEAEDGGSRASWLARNAAQPQGKKVGEAVAGTRPARRQTSQQERPQGRLRAQ